jgi:hypothetical protein
MDALRNTQASIEDIVKNDSENLTEDQKKILIQASDILFWESVSRNNAYFEQMVWGKDESN